MPSPAEKGGDVSGNVARPRPTSSSSNLRPLLPRWSPAAYSEHLAASRALLGGTVAWHARSSSINSGRETGSSGAAAAAATGTLERGVQAASGLVKARDRHRPVQQSKVSTATTGSSNGGMLCPKGRSDSNDPSCGGGGTIVRKRGLEESARSLPQTRPLPQAMSAVPARKKNWRPHCRHHTCLKPASFAAGAEQDPVFCEKHKATGMINVVHPNRGECQEHGCRRVSAYSSTAATTACFCYEHKKTGMVKVRDGIGTRCEDVECVKQASFALEGERYPRFCRDHKGGNMINIRNTRCLAPGCPRGASFAPIGERRGVYCGEHRKEGMINTRRRPRCMAPGCSSREPIYVPEGHQRPQYCAEHRGEGMTTLCRTRATCVVPNCCRQPTETVAGEPFPRFCDIHKSMLDVSTPPQSGATSASTSGCRMENCTTMPSFGWEAAQVAVFCRLHAQCGMVNVTNRGVQLKGPDQQTARIPNQHGGGDTAPPAEVIRTSAPAAAPTQSRSAAESAEHPPVRMGDRGKLGSSLEPLARAAAVPAGHLPAVHLDNGGQHTAPASKVSTPVATTIGRPPLRFDQYRNQAMPFGFLRQEGSSNSERRSYGVADFGRKMGSVAASPPGTVSGPAERHSVVEGYGDQRLNGVHLARKVSATAEDDFVRVGCHKKQGHPSAAPAKNAGDAVYRPFGRVFSPSKQVGPTATLASAVVSSVRGKQVLETRASSPARSAAAPPKRRSTRIARVTEDDGQQAKMGSPLDSAVYRFDESHDKLAALTENGRLPERLSAYTMAGTAQVHLGSHVPNAYTINSVPGQPLSTMSHLDIHRPNGHHLSSLQLPQTDSSTAGNHGSDDVRVKTSGQITSGPNAREAVQRRRGMKQRSCAHLPPEGVGEDNQHSPHAPANTLDGAANALPEVGTDGGIRDDGIRGIPRETRQPAPKKRCNDRSAPTAIATATGASSRNAGESEDSRVGTSVPDRNPPGYTRTAFYYTLVNALTRKRRRGSDSAGSTTTGISGGSRSPAQPAVGGAKGGGGKGRF